ncbi:hypothetical protein CWE13_08155 [Aliidiomarina shirensis]|uniref:Outer membrane protein beta-barrel domain-containing protein n=1 Tax=Aliidiomarina shirensis TaxID=1048642 RepID=A0A432WSR1_9GAMM|nr:hypothetical protein [Aliidiomarina shirensis]RUO36811.1 hypothetical protein CWE13_08155 [Aliidiomarina shirensis]
MLTNARSLKCFSLLATLGFFSAFINANALASDTENTDTNHSPNWRLLDISYATVRDRDSDAKADMLNLRASLPVKSYGLAAIELSSGEVTNGQNVGDMNAYQLNIMGGLRMAASERADLFILAGATRVEMETNSYNVSDDGFISQAGMRGKLTENIDLSSYIQFSKTGGLSTSSWHGDVRYNLLNRIDLYVAAGIYSRSWSGKVGFSFHF